MTNPILEKWFVHVKALRDGTAKPDEWDGLDPKTRIDYAAKYARLAGRLPADVATCKRSYYGYRAAWRHMKSRETREALNKMDAWLRERDHDAITEADFAAQVTALGLGALSRGWREFTNAKFEGAVRGAVQTTHGKRKIGNLPRGWKSKLLGRVPRDSRYKLHVHVMALCGCRPSEFEDGVGVARTDEDTYTVTILGKKQGDRTHKGKTFTTGQAVRVLTFKRGADFDKDGWVNNEFNVLDRLMDRLMVDERGKPCRYMELKASATAIRDVVIHASEKAFPDIKNRPTAYSFRHAVASELKAQNGECSEQTALVLGHASAKTQGCYGYGRSGGRGGLTVSAEASGRVRHVGATKSYTKKVKAATTAKVVQKNSGVGRQASRCAAAFRGGTNVGDVTLAKLSASPARAANPNLYVPQKPAPSFARGIRI